MNNKNKFALAVTAAFLTVATAQVNAQAIPEKHNCKTKDAKHEKHDCKKDMKSEKHDCKK